MPLPAPARPRPAPRRGAAFILIAISAYPTSAHRRNEPQSTAACPAAADRGHPRLRSRWLAEPPAPAPGATATPQLGHHAALAHSVRGTVQRGGTTAPVSGDADGGDPTLEESINGMNISTPWTGQVVDGSCGKEIRGTWNNAHPTPAAPSAPFVLRKLADWQ